MIIRGVLPVVTGLSGRLATQRLLNTSRYIGVVKLKQLVVLISLSVMTVSMLVGCGVPKQPSSNMTGAVLGWDNNLYKLTAAINANRIGKKLGEVSYHGSVSGVFTIFQLSGSTPAKDVVFETNGHYYGAVVTKSN